MFWVVYGIAFPEIDVNIQQNDLKNPWITK